MMMMMISQSPLEKMLWFYSLKTALCESIRYQAKSEQNVQDLIPRLRHEGDCSLHTVGRLKFLQKKNILDLGYKKVKKYFFLLDWKQMFVCAYIGKKMF